LGKKKDQKEKWMFLKFGGSKSVSVVCFLTGFRIRFRSLNISIKIYCIVETFQNRTLLSKWETTLQNF
jgi:hypothetical protein